jgi:hypothetical protein
VQIANASARIGDRRTFRRTDARVTHSYSHGRDLPVRRPRAVVCSETSGSWQGSMLLCRMHSNQGDLLRLRIMASAIMTAPKIGTAQPLAGAMSASNGTPTCWCRPDVGCVSDRIVAWRSSSGTGLGWLCGSVIHCIWPDGCGRPLMSAAICNSGVQVRRRGQTNRSSVLASSAVQQSSAAAHRYSPRARLLERAWPAPQ